MKAHDNRIIYIIELLLSVQHISQSKFITLKINERIDKRYHDKLNRLHIIINYFQTKLKHLYLISGYSVSHSVHIDLKSHPIESGKYYDNVYSLIHLEDNFFQIKYNLCDYPFYG